MKKIWNLPRVELASFDDIQETQPVLLVTSAPAWNAVKASLRGLNIVETIEVKEATTENWDSLLTMGNGKSSVVYAVGGGLTADAAK
ncbi:MAG: hypothetical protein MZU91_02410 [Desulfosudis oleivorans]|nr:hypothetical protein [Desulfosudis oleivorans]